MNDELYQRAVELARSEGTIRISLIQRKLNVGYTTASMIIERLERDGIVGPLVMGDIGRQVLV